MNINVPSSPNQPASLPTRNARERAIGLAIDASERGVSDDCLLATAHRIYEWIADGKWQ